MKSRRVTKENLKSDRLSSLPESLTIGILSFVEFKEAVKTCVLSKQWRFVWMQLPRLEFKERWRSELSRSTETKSVDIVNRLIAVGGRDGVHTFSVELDYQKRFASDVNAWVEFAAANKVENLSVLLHTAEPPDELFRTPSSLEWRCLRSLSLGRVRFTSQQHLENLLSRCPVLESLELNLCRGFHRLDVGNPSFRRLRVVSSRGRGDDYLREISAAHMRELEVSTMTPMRVSNAPALHQASIDISNYEYEDYGNYRRMDDVINLLNQFQDIGHVNLDNLFQHIGRVNLLNLFQDIRHVNKLDLRGNSIRVISEMAKWPGIEFPQFRLQNLAICAANRHISGILALLRSSPNLENLLISCLRTETMERVEIEAGELDNWDELLHLKFVDIAFTGSTTVKLVQIILEKAPALEQMVIRNASFSSRNSRNIIDLSRNSRYFNEKCQALLRYPKSSKKAKLRIHQ